MTTTIVVPVVAQPSIVRVDSMGYQDWWCPCGITPSDCIAAYLAKGAGSYTKSKINLANPGTYDLYTNQNVPSWDDINGWSFGLSDYLTSSDVISSLDIYTMIARFSDVSEGPNSTAFVYYGDINQGAIHPDDFEGVSCVKYTDNASTAVPPSLLSGILAATYETTNHLVTGYRNGIIDLPETIDNNLTFDSARISIGFTGILKVQACAIYNKKLTAVQIGDLTDAMEAL